MARYWKGTGMEDSGRRCKLLLVTDVDNGEDLIVCRDEQGRIIQAYPMLQSGFSSITYAVFDMGTEQPRAGTTIPAGSSVTTGTVTISSAVFNTLQEGGWPKDGVGWNFGFEVPAAAFPTGDRWYWVEFKFTPASGAVWHEVFEIFIHRIETT